MASQAQLQPRREEEVPESGPRGQNREAWQRGTSTGSSEGHWLSERFPEGAVASGAAWASRWLGCHRDTDVSEKFCTEVTNFA